MFGKKEGNQKQNTKGKEKKKFMIKNSFHLQQ